MHFRLEVGDLAATSFAYSPLNEAVASLRVREHPGLYPEHLPFRRATAGAFASLDTGLLSALVAPNPVSTGRHRRPVVKSRSTARPSLTVPRTDGSLETWPTSRPCPTSPSLDCLPAASRTT